MGLFRITRRMRQNFALFTGIISLTLSFPIYQTVITYDNIAFAQTQPDEDFSERRILQITNASISGKYDYEGEVKLTFPSGWTGIEISEEDGSTVVTSVSPSGMEGLDDLEEIGDPIMFLVISRKGSVDVAPGSVPPIIGEKDGDALVECESTSRRIALVNGVFSVRSLSECSVVPSSSSDNSTSGAPGDGKVMILHSLLTQTTSWWVSLIFFGTPTTHETHQQTFETTLSSLIVNGALDLNVAFGSPTGSSYNIFANGTLVPIDLKTTSEISDFRFDEENKAVMFTATGLSFTDGITEISIGRVLSPPYLVTIDGEEWSDFEILRESITNEETIQIRYEHGPSMIVIKGTEVVPEFDSNSMISPVAVAVGVVTTALIVRARRAFRQTW